jgi:hypothetical protein
MDKEIGYINANGIEQEHEEKFSWSPKIVTFFKKSRITVQKKQHH